MTAITRNLPWFIKDLGVAIVGQECYTSLVENLDVTDVKCLKYSLSKGLGIGIVVGGSIMKVPQIILILKAQSARGLSIEAYVLETLSYAITLAYSYRNEFPFSTYGENFFLTIQNVFITILILIYTPARAAVTRSSSSKSQTIVLASLATIITGLSLTVAPPPLLSLLQMTTLPLSLFSKLPQIRQNARSKSTGQLSAFAVISQIAGCLARLFTTTTEVGDALLAAAFGLALMLNLVLGAQLWMYWGDEEMGGGAPRREGPKVYEMQDAKQGGGAPPLYPSSPSWASASQPSPPLYQPTAVKTSGTPSPSTQANLRLSTPPPRPSSTGRKWARKVD